MKSRFVLAQMEQKGLPEENLESARKAVAEAMEPVSYTHLDVYKRQETPAERSGQRYT